MAEISREELERLYKYLDNGFSGVHDRLDRQNGRVGTVEQKVAVLEDRSTGHGASAAMGGGVAAAMIGAMEVFRWLFSK